jgi:hypothetical protein
VQQALITQGNLNKVTCSLKEGLDLNKLSTTGADFELVGTDDPYIEDEEEVEEKMRYQQNIVQHLKPECADLDHGGSEDEEAVENGSNGVASKASGWAMVLYSLGCTAPLFSF